MAGYRKHSVLFLCAVGALAHPAKVSQRSDDTEFQFGTIGDSWASGVTYGLFGYTNYDDNSDGCMRINHAYGVQLNQDWPFNTSPDTIAPHNFTFAACSGAKLVNMAENNPQLDKIPKEAHFVTMQAGGNDAGFYNIAQNCIYHEDPNVNYGAPYPDPNGACYQAIQFTENFIQAGHELPGIWKFMDDTINDILNYQDRNTLAPFDFKLYVLGYAHFFNVQSPDSDWCNDISFSVSPNEWFGGSPKPLLSNALRSKINDLTTQLNNQIVDVITNRNDKRVEYISTTEGFTGHRFCEQGSTWSQQFLSYNVWYWNASPLGLVPANSQVAGLNSSAPDTTTLGNLQMAANNAWLNAYGNTTTSQASNTNAFDWTDLLAMDKGPSAQSPHQGWSPGVALRPFHPNMYGHGAIKDILKAQVAKDFVDGR